MATKKNDIALSFDKAEYYTLQEASDYLNRKHGIDSVTPKKLLKFVLKQAEPYTAVAIYIAVKGIQLSADIKFDNFRDFEREYWNEKIKKLEGMITTPAEDLGLFLRLDDWSIRDILFFGETTVSEYNNAFRSYSYLFDFKDSESTLADYAYSQYGFKNLAILAIYPRLTVSKQCNLEAELAKIKHNFTYEIYDTDDDSSYYLMLHLKFNINDLILFHTDLVALENFILDIESNEKPHETKSKNISQPIMISPPTYEALLEPRTANNASKIIAALASELLELDLTKPYADETNGKILKSIERQGNTLGKDTIAYWIRKAHDISK